MESGAGTNNGTVASPANPVDGGAKPQAGGGSAKKVKVSDKDVDLTHAPRGVWLVKVPKYLSDRWEKCPAGASVATLSIRKAPNKKPDIRLSIADEVTAARIPGSSSTSMSSTPGKSAKERAVSNAAVPIGRNVIDQKIPSEHNLIVSTPVAQTLAVFSTLKPTDQDREAGKADKLALEGRVVQRADCRPVNNQTYMSVKRESIKKAIEPARKAVKLDRVAVNYKPVGNHKTNIEHEKLKREEGKKSRDEKEIVMEKLFALFEKHQYYNIRDLVKETRQPVTYLKEILKECCTYRVQNPHKNTWELKAEFRHYKTEEDPKQSKEDADMSSDDEDME